MRKLAILGAVVLALVAVTPVFAASSPRTGSATHAAAAVPHTWRASATKGHASAASRLSVTSSLSGGAFSTAIKGAAPKTTATSRLVIGACGAATDVTVTSFVRTTSAAGVAKGSVKLTKAQAAQVEAAVRAGQKLSSTVTDGSMRLCGAFSG